MIIVVRRIIRKKSLHFRLAEANYDFWEFGLGLRRWFLVLFYNFFCFNFCLREEINSFGPQRDNEGLLL